MRAVPDFSARDHAGRLTHQIRYTRRVDCEMRELTFFHRTHPIPTMKLIFATFVSSLCVGGSSAFVANQRSAGGAVSHRPLTSSSPCSSALNMGGFGGGGGGMGKKGGKKGGKKSGSGGSAPLKLKAKAQWDK